ncbi:LPXTG cell wall anchor domain-containing protein [Allorhizocola rhizosphaerae]|uniref:LPXTG cell wall anchor domain-containing protein n=1 Tax=Allorhizocola rhizosphaerae TaxID=1872709 RepID=UPI000E3D60FC|nr:LPXTG cell wall anchor domain-containing protein [Allorhizocola rhizosphaerae]
MAKWIVAGALIATVVSGAAPAAGAAAPSARFTNVCGGVTVTTDAPAGADVRISRDGKPVGGFPLAGGTFTIGAHEGLSVGVAIGGAPEVTHRYSDPANCSSGSGATPTFDDFCFGGVFIDWFGTNRAVATAAAGFIVTVNGTPHTVPAGPTYYYADGVPDNAVIGVYMDLRGGERAFYAGHVYRAPTGCGTSSLSVRFTDHCYGVRADVTSTASGIQRWGAFHGQTAVPPVWVRGNSTAVQQITGVAEGTAITLKLLTPPGTETEFATHTYRTPAACASPWKTAVSFVDTCAGTSVTITSLADIREYWIDADGVRHLVLLALGESKTEDVRGATVVVSAGGRMEGDPDRTVATHTYTTPSGCGGLPVTGARTATIAASGAIIALLGVGVFVLARRRRVPR